MKRLLLWEEDSEIAFSEEIEGKTCVQKNESGKAYKLIGWIITKGFQTYFEESKCCNPNSKGQCIS
jgi:hypothetical protein